MLSVSGRLYAYACIAGTQDAPELSGVVRFSRTPAGTLVEARIWGLPEKDGFFGFHIHEGRSCTGVDLADTKGHYNPEKKEHPGHAGDLPPLLSVGGRAYMTVLTGRFSPGEILGRTVVIHAHSDDFRTQPGGDSGRKFGCGVIKPVKSENEGKRNEIDKNW